MVKKDRRFKFYPEYYIFLEHLDKIKAILTNLDNETTPKNINDVIELYNIKKQFEKKEVLINYLEQEFDFYYSKCGHIMSAIARYFSEVSETNLKSKYSVIEKKYIDDFWVLFVKLKIYSRISVTVFSEFLTECTPMLCYILYQKKLSEIYGLALREYMIDSDVSAELLINEYEGNHRVPSPSLIFPKELSNSDKESIIRKYIVNKNANINYLRMIMYLDNNKDKINLSYKTKLLAKNRVKEIEQSIISKFDDSCLRWEINIASSEKQIEPAIVQKKGMKFSFIYDLKWITNNLDYPTLMNNFIYLFNYADLQMRCLLVNKTNEMGFEKYLFILQNKTYTSDSSFMFVDRVSLMQMMFYYDVLQKNNIRIEEIIEWFFHEYVPLEFKINGFYIQMPSKNSTMLEKCTSVLPALESILKQYKLYVGDGCIDLELLDIMSDQLIYERIPSLIEKKYVYGEGEKYNKITHAMFSNQSGLCYIEKTGESNTNFYELILNKRLQKKDTLDFQKAEIEWLINEMYIIEDKDGYLMIRDTNTIEILRDIYFNDVTNYWKLSKFSRNKIDLMYADGIVVFKSALLTESEQDYINYFLNKYSFNNGPNLRNKYSHTQPNVDKNDETHKEDYMSILRIFILIIIKINDDLCIYDKLKHKQD